MFKYIVHVYNISIWGSWLGYLIILTCSILATLSFSLSRLMSNLSMVEAKLPPGFRFHPRDEELICDYLLNKVTCCDCHLMIEVDLNKCEPWDIPGE